MDTNRHEENSCDILQVEGINSKGFGFAPKLVMLDVRLSIESKAIYCYFSSYAGAGKIAFPRVSKIIDDLRISRPTYYTHFNPLKEFGYIKVEQTRKDGRKSHNIYTLMDIVPKPANARAKVSDKGDETQDAKILHTEAQEENNPGTDIQDAEFLHTEKQSTKFLHTETPDTKILYAEKQDAKILYAEKQDTEKQDAEYLADSNSNILFKNNRSKSNTFEKHPPYPPQAGNAGAVEQIAGGIASQTYAVPETSVKNQTQPSENLMLQTGGGEDSQSSSHSTTLADQRFEMFWDAYPKKVGKSAVLKAWNRLNPNGALFARMIAAISAAKASEQWQRENGRYIPNPLTWINQGRWDDECPVSAPYNQPPQRTGNAITRILERLEAAEAAHNNEILEGEYDN